MKNRMKYFVFCIAILAMGAGLNGCDKSPDGTSVDAETVGEVKVVRVLDFMADDGPCALYNASGDGMPSRGVFMLHCMPSNGTTSASSDTTYDFTSGKNHRTLVTVSD